MDSSTDLNFMKEVLSNFMSSGLSTKSRDTLEDFSVETIKQNKHLSSDKTALLSLLGGLFQTDLLQSQCTADIFEVVFSIEVLLDLLFIEEVVVDEELVGLDDLEEETLTSLSEEDECQKNDISFKNTRKNVLNHEEFDYLGAIKSLTASVLSIMKYVLIKEEKRISSYSEYKGEEIIIQCDSAIIADLSIASLMRCIYDLILKYEKLKCQDLENIQNNVNQKNDENYKIGNENEIKIDSKFDTDSDESESKYNDKIDNIKDEEVNKTNSKNEILTTNSKIEILINKIQDVSIKKIENNIENDNDKNKIKIETISHPPKLKNKQKILTNSLTRRKKNDLQEKNVFLPLNGFCLMYLKYAEMKVFKKNKNKNKSKNKNKCFSCKIEI